MRRYLKILEYARPHRGWFAAIFVLTLVVSGVAILQPLPVTWVIDHLLGNVPMSGTLHAILNVVAPHAGKTGMLAIFALAVIGIYLLNSVLDIALTYAWTVAGRRMVNDLMIAVFERLQRRSLLYHSRAEVGDSMSRVMVDSWCVHDILEKIFFAPLLAVLTIAGMVVLMASFQPVLTMIAVIVGPFMVAASFVLGKQLHAAASKRREVEIRIQSHIQQTLSGIPVVQAFAQEDRESERFQQYAAAAIQAQQQAMFLTSIGGFSSGLVTTLGMGVILWVGAHYVSVGKLTLGGLWLFVGYLNTLQTHIKTLAAVYPSMQAFRTSVDRILEALQSAPDLPEKPGAPILPPVRGQIRIENVTTGYAEGQAVLNKVSVDVQPGRVLAIVGATGAGKSTMVGLIPRFLDPWQGRVLIDGHDLREVQLESVRSQVAVVLQESYLFPVSIAENIAYGRSGASRAEIEKAARVANAHEFIERLPDGYDTIVGERGATLSGGERQRIAIARALLKDAPILILDEPTSALDAETEALMLEALERLMAGRTTFIIAHRLSTVRRADQIVVLKDGAICEAGTHAELLAHGGVYAHFHKLQFAPEPDGPSGPLPQP